MADFGALLRNLGQQAKAFPEMVIQRRQQAGRQLEKKLPQAPTPDMSILERAGQAGKFAAGQPLQMASNFLQAEQPPMIGTEQVTDLMRRKFMAKETLSPEEEQLLAQAMQRSVGMAGMTAPQAVDMSQFIDDAAIAAVNAGDDVPTSVGDGVFKIKYKATDAWRGHYDVTATKGSGWEKLGDDWVTGNYSDAGANAASAQEVRFSALATKVQDLGGELKIILTPTSNVFSTGMDIFVKGVEKSLLQGF
ncbi:MAG: hypothetical protein KAJ75_06875 [Alphaproteobacteria bacterium]|nr:hypothetical protein [Alphaproteobacteria bacterium]